ncbi:MAG: PLP-dependent aminotransferase family protein [Bacteroidota bacterium]
MLPFARLLSISSRSSTPIYLQIVSQMIHLIEEGQLQAGQRLPGSRTLAELLQLNRNTIVAAYDELAAQGWIRQERGSGTYVSEQIPAQQVRELGVRRSRSSQSPPFKSLNWIDRSQTRPQTPYQLNDGLPDIRLAPLKELSREYRRVLTQRAWRSRLEYGDPQGNGLLREQLRRYLGESRGLQFLAEQIMITRGVIMSLYLLAQVLIEPGDAVVVGESTYKTANMSFLQAGAQLLRLPVDENGLRIEELEALCRQNRVKAIYVASHHHHPTTVPLSASRRVALLDLARRYDFWIIEDDYDFMFHYQRNPILPIASMGASERVVYLGSFSKTLAPALRTGYLVGPPALLEVLGRLRRLVDRQGDQILEEAIGLMLQEGSIQRHLRKALNIYRTRRDVFCRLLREEIGEAVSFQVPEGGLAVWAHFVERQDLQEVCEECLQRGLFLSSGAYYQFDNQPDNKTRLGFAYHTEEELGVAVQILKMALQA